jgi:hypothetical protein
VERGVPPWQDRRGLLPSRYDDSGGDGGDGDEGDEGGGGRRDEECGSTDKRKSDAWTNPGENATGERGATGDGSNDDGRRAGWKGRAKAVARRRAGAFAQELE